MKSFKRLTRGKEGLGEGGRGEPVSDSGAKFSVFPPPLTFILPSLPSSLLLGHRSQLLRAALEGEGLHWT